MTRSVEGPLCQYNCFVPIFAAVSFLPYRTTFAVSWSSAITASSCSVFQSPRKWRPLPFRRPPLRLPRRKPGTEPANSLPPPHPFEKPDDGLPSPGYPFVANASYSDWAMKVSPATLG